MLIKNRIIMQDKFIDSLSKLMNIEMPAKQCLEVSKSIEELIGQYQIILRAYKAIMEKYCMKNDNGIPIKDENNNLKFENEEIKNKFIKEINEIMDEEIDITLSEKIKIKGNSVNMTPLMYKILEDIIEIV
jgi:DNA-binding SARP family transcriptional activator